MNKTVFRILIGGRLQEKDFYNYSELFPENERYKKICKAYALSFFDTKEHAITAKKNAKRNIGNYICEMQITFQVGKNIFNDKSGHYSTWIYKSWDYSNFAFSNIEQLYEN